MDSNTNTKTQTTPQPGRPVVVTEGDADWPRPMYLAAACQLLGLTATVHEQQGRPFRITLPHSVRVLEQLRETAQRMQESAEDPRVGATGEYPDGEAVVGDEGEMQFAVGAMVEEQLVVVSFGKAVAWLGMSATDARQLAALLTAQADTLDAHAAEQAASAAAHEAGG